MTFNHIYHIFGTTFCHCHHIFWTTFGQTVTFSARVSVDGDGLCGLWQTVGGHAERGRTVGGTLNHNHQSATEERHRGGAERHERGSVAVAGATQLSGTRDLKRHVV